MFRTRSAVSLLQRRCLAACIAGFLVAHAMAADADDGVIEALKRYHWPGNIRELHNFIERSVILSRGAELESPLAELQTTAVAAAAGVGGADQGAARKPTLTTMDEMERTYIEEVLRHANGMIAGKGGAAEILGMPSSTLRSRMKKLGIK